MRSIYTTLLSLFLLFLGTVLNAQDNPKEEPENNFKMSAQLRSRFELRDGAFRPLNKNENPAALILNRVRIHLNYQYKDILKTKITLQNVNIWGQASPFQENDESGNNTAISEAWAALKVVEDLWVKVGRQSISFEDGRLFSPADWTNSGRTHDALSLQFENKKWVAKTFFAFNQNYADLYGNNINNPSGNLYNITNAHNYKTMQTGWLTYQTDAHSHLSFLFSNVGYQNAQSLLDREKVRFLQTTGIFYDFNYFKIFGELSGYYQFGHALSSRKINAFLLSFNLGTSVSDRFKISIGTDYVSGNTLGQNTSTDRAFHPLYGTGHKFYGNMDYFSFVKEGLIDNRLHFHYALHDKMDIDITGHLFYTPTKIKINQQQFKNNLGQEIDAKVHYQLQKFVSLSAGYSTYFTTSTLLKLKGISNAKKMQNWTWVSLNIYPEFLKSKF